jgi:hypothetical protein
MLARDDAPVWCHSKPLAAQDRLARGLNLDALLPQHDRQPQFANGRMFQDRRWTVLLSDPQIYLRTRAFGKFA